MGDRMLLLSAKSTGPLANIVPTGDGGLLRLESAMALIDEPDK
jgi:hypothetical protein